MENEATSTPQESKSKIMPIGIIGAIIVIIIIGAIVFSMNGGNNDSQIAEQPAVTQPVGDAMEAQLENSDEMMTSYADGTYDAEGMYTSPGGEESIAVTLTLLDGIVEEAEVTANATRPISKQMQASFIEGYKEMVVGKKIDEINLSKVSASSLAPKGFNDAVEKIKSQAMAAS